jgi:tetratricopeptide (TPR) repeat protein
MNNPEKALELYSRALSLYEKFGDTMNIAGTTTNIGSIYIQLGDYDIAREYYKKGLRVFKQINNKAGQAHALFKLGLLDEKENLHQNALELLQRSLEIQKSIDINPGGSKTMFKSETIIHIGINYLALHDVQKAKSYLEEGLYIARQTDQHSLIALAAKHLSIIEKQNGNYRQALVFHELYKQYSDSAFNAENIRKLTQLEMQHHFETKLAHARLEKELEMQKRKRNNLIYIVLTTGLLLILIIIALLLKLEKNKKKKLETERKLLEEKLEHTNKELTTHVMYLLHKNEFILSIIEKLKKAHLDAKPENKKIISELIRELKTNTDSVSWEEFEVRFQEVHTGFYTNIRKAYPDLTTNEIRLCAFFRLNMTSKEIAAITYQSLNSIKVARYRLRKKLRLSQDDNLISFLSKF